jgi:hypothetical protein
MIEEWVKNAIFEATYWRGKISNSYAQVEFLLGDLIVKCRDVAEYKDIPGNLPHGAPDRVRRVGILLKESGPLDPFRDEITALMDRFSAKHETRNLLAHGLCTTHWGRQTKRFSLEFKKFHRNKGENEDWLLTRNFTMDGLREEAQEMGAMADEGLALFRRIHDQMEWSEP